ncbi:hypothetical protein [Glycomyces buryatensis]|uniref:Uncharacterized protein n=1 Tax=Glycomyces buryatensis TaxID=2570927 RepID=A0A4S8Q5S6_9ACTN|nr:hypothetical protein [Glycomyces buryatensis]THV39613.1 hypothetical protein FAB82_17230 [Glycomyces buryatensis]
MRAHTPDLDADFLHHYGLDLAHLGTRRLTWARFAGLLVRLPAQSRSLRAIGGRVDDWDAPTHLAAASLDTARQTNYLIGALLTAHGAKKNPVTKPDPVPRPGHEATGRKRRGFRALFSHYGTHVRSIG